MSAQLVSTAASSDRRPGGDRAGEARRADLPGLCGGTVKIGIVTLSSCYRNVNRIATAYKAEMANGLSAELDSGGSASTQLAAWAELCEGNASLCGGSLSAELMFVEGLIKPQVKFFSPLNTAAALAGVEISNAVRGRIAEIGFDAFAQEGVEFP